MMKEENLINKVFIGFTVMLLLIGSSLCANQFTQEELKAWDAEYVHAVDDGRKLFSDANLGESDRACNQCHPNAANTHPETYPKFQRQLGKVVTIGEMVNWCIANSLMGEKMAMDSKEMVSLISYITYQRRDVPLAPGKH